MIKYTSRKFYLTVGALLIIVVALSVGKIDQSIFSNLLMFILGQYSIANVVGEKLVNVKNGNGNGTKTDLPS